MKHLWLWLLIIALAMILWATIPLFVHAQEAKSPSVYLNLGEFYIVRGDSMLPTIQNGDLVTVPWEKRIKPRAGQIILFKAFLPERTIVAHRVIKMGEDDNGWWAITKGDNNTNEDLFFVRESNYIGIAWGRLTIW